MWNELIMDYFKMMFVRAMQGSHGTYVINGEGRQIKVVAYVKKVSRLAGSAKETRADLANLDR
jgi:hypothetical protein